MTLPQIGYYMMPDSDVEPMPPTYQEMLDHVAAHRASKQSEGK